MNRSFLLLFFVFALINCGKDESITDCDGALTILVDEEELTFGAPFNATLSPNNFTQSHELNLVWVGNNENISLQLLIELGSKNCLDIGRIDSNNLPDEVSIFSLQYISTSGTEAGVNNVFFDPKASGWIEIIECDGTNDIISVDFEFNGISADGNTEIIFKNGKAKNICFSRTK